MQGQRGSCLETEKLALCLKGGGGKAGEGALGSSMLLSGLGLELCSWVGHQGRPCLSNCVSPAATGLHAPGPGK